MKKSNILIRNRMTTSTRMLLSVLRVAGKRLESTEKVRPRGGVNWVERYTDDGLH